VTVTRRAIRALARRWVDLNTEIKTHTAELDELTKTAAPGLVAQQGVSVDVAAKLLIAAGDNPERLGSEASFAALCGVNPIQASSGKTTRHRLNRSGDRQANNALWTIARVRLSRDPETIAYAERREQEHLTRREIVRCLKRYLARRLYPIILADLAELT
jgi:transposase